MKEEIVALLGLGRDKILQNTKIPKTEFYKLDDFNAEKKRIFTNDINEIVLLAILNEETINIAPLKNSEVNYEEISVIYVDLKKDDNKTKIIETIEKNIPNPTIIILSFENKVCLATARKRLNKAEQGKQVIESVETTPWLPLVHGTDTEDAYVKGLNIANFSFSNLFVFYQEFSLYVYQSVLLPFSSKFAFIKQLSIDELQLLVGEYQTKQAEVKRLKEEESKTLNFGDKVAIHAKVNRAEGEAEQASGAIKIALEKYGK